MTALKIIAIALGGIVLLAGITLIGALVALRVFIASGGNIDMDININSKEDETNS